MTSLEHSWNIGIYNVIAGFLIIILVIGYIFKKQENKILQIILIAIVLIIVSIEIAFLAKFKDKKESDDNSQSVQALLAFQSIILIFFSIALPLLGYFVYKLFRPNSSN